MSTHNNWVKQNLNERRDNPAASFKVEINPYYYKEMSFHDAADYTAKLISEKHDKLYLALSGGADSDFVLHCFQRCNLPINVVIVKTTGNDEELSYAYKSCEKFKIDPIILELSDKEYLNIYYEEVIKKIFGYGIYSVPSIVACRYAKENDGVLIIGEHMIEGQKPDETGVVRMRPAFNEWDFYNEFLIGEEWNIPFFNYTLELACAMIGSINSDPIDVFKANLYGIEHRPIIDYKFSDDFMKVKTVIDHSKMRTAQPYFGMGSKEQFLSILNKWKIEVN
jgi:hypothetical protein